MSAFRHITDALRRAGLDRTATVWCAAGGSAGFIDFSELMAYYPGDEYVDWWGVDTFSAEKLRNPWLGRFYRATPEIKAISYINWDWAYRSDELGFSWRDWEDARIETDDLIRQLYVEELGLPMWIHSAQAERIP